MKDYPLKMMADRHGYTLYYDKGRNKQGNQIRDNIGHYASMKGLLTGIMEHGFRESLTEGSDAPGRGVSSDFIDTIDRIQVLISDALHTLRDTLRGPQMEEALEAPQETK